MVESVFSLGDLLGSGAKPRPLTDSVDCSRSNAELLFDLACAFAFVVEQDDLRFDLWPYSLLLGFCTRSLEDPVNGRVGLAKLAGDLCVVQGLGLGQLNNSRLPVWADSFWHDFHFSKAMSEKRMKDDRATPVRLDDCLL
jgi:hypothetical protein